MRLQATELLKKLPHQKKRTRGTLAAEYAAFGREEVLFGSWIGSDGKVRVTSDMSSES